jgi:hypothetical protein
MQESLHVTDKQFLMVLTIFFIPYALFVFEVRCFRVISELLIYTLV